MLTCVARCQACLLGHAVADVRARQGGPATLSVHGLGSHLPSTTQIAEGEAKAGHAGSKALRAAALRCLRRLIDAVGDGDALAFVLPGVASGLLRALLVAGALARYCRAVARLHVQCSFTVLSLCFNMRVFSSLCRARAIDRSCAQELPGPCFPNLMSPELPLR